MITDGKVFYDMFWAIICMCLQKSSLSCPPPYVCIFLLCFSLMQCLNFIIRAKLGKLPKFFSLIIVGLPASCLGRLVNVVQSSSSLHSLGNGGEPPALVGSLLKEKAVFWPSELLFFSLCQPETWDRLGPTGSPQPHLPVILPPSTQLMTP